MTAGHQNDSALDLAELVDYLDEFLDAAEFEDYGPNGLQVEGVSPVRKVVTGVSGCVELFERAHAADADAIVVHHGLFWSGLSPVLTGANFRRVALLVETGMSLLGYHLPLDAHPTIGNNAIAARHLGIDQPLPFGLAKGHSIGFRGSLPESLDSEELAERCRRLYGQEPLVLGATERPIRTVGVVSGGGQSVLHEAIAAGVDAFVTGEASEWVTHLARESGLCYVAAGHHATERLGIRALGEHLAGHFGLDVEFIDVPNPV